MCIYSHNAMHQITPWCIKLLLQGIWTPLRKWVPASSPRRCGAASPQRAKWPLSFAASTFEVSARAHSNQPRLSAALHFCVTPCYLHFPARFCHSSRPSWRPSLATSKAFTFGSGPSNTGLHLSAAAAASAPHRVSCSRALEKNM